MREATEVDAVERSLLMYYASGEDEHFEEFADWAEEWLSTQAEYLLRRCAGDRVALSADLVQVVLVKVARSRDRARWSPARSSVRTWLSRILRNVVYSHWRSRVARNARRQVKLTEELLWGASSRVGLAADAVERLMREDEGRQAYGLMCQMPDEYRRSVELVVLEGYSHAEASRRLGVSAATVGRRVQKALKLLRNLCEGRRRLPARGNSAWMPLSA